LIWRATVNGFFPTTTESQRLPPLVVDETDERKKIDKTLMQFDEIIEIKKMILKK